MLDKRDYAIIGLSLFALALFGGLIFLKANAAIDLSGTSPDVAKSFAKANDLNGFKDWVLPAYGHYNSEWELPLDMLGRPTSLMNWSGDITPLPANVINSSNESRYSY
jgi:hypothetical protein